MNSPTSSIKWWPTTVLAAKLGLIGAIAVIMASNLWVILAAAFPRSEARTDEAPSDADVAAIALTTPPMAALVPEASDGAWQIAGLPWRVRVRAIPADEAPEELCRWPDVPASTDTPLTDDARDLHTTVIELAETLGGEPERHAGMRAWRFQRGGRRFRVVATGADAATPRVLLARAVWQAGGQTRLAEAWLTTSDRVGSDSGPPLPTGAELVAVRYDTAGQVAASLADCPPETHDGIRRLWRDAGWDAREASFLEDQAARRYLLERDGVFYLADVSEVRGGQATISYTRSQSPSTGG